MLTIFLAKPFLLAFLALILATIASSLLGVFVLWKKLFYFGDAMSHSILFGAALSLVFNSNQTLTLIAFAVLFAIIANYLSQSRFASKSMAVAVLSYFSIACAFLLEDFTQNHNDFHQLIFGDILEITQQEITLLAAIAALSAIYTIFSFRKILLINLNQDLAKIHHININRWNLSFLILLSLTVALSVQIVGIFLMTSLLILPAAIARIFSRSPKEMIILSLFIGIIISSSSFFVANIYDLKIGATIAISFCLIFFACQIFNKSK